MVPVRCLLVPCQRCGAFVGFEFLSGAPGLRKRTCDCRWSEWDRTVHFMVAVSEVLRLQVLERSAALPVFRGRYEVM